MESPVLMHVYCKFHRFKIRRGRNVPRRLAEDAVKEFRVMQNYAVVLAEKEKEIVKVNKEVVLIVSW